MENKFVAWLKQNLGCVLGFLVPFAILGGIFIGSEVVPWGEDMYLRSDCYHQYAPFYKELYRKLTEGGSLEYSWNIGMGVNFTAIYAYYLASPINLLLGLLPEGMIIHAMDFLILLKTALAGLTCAYYLKKRFNTKSSTVAVAATFYALSSYMAAFSWNIMWLDCIALLPLVVLGLEKLVNEGKYKLYTIALGVTIFSNYYIAIMICMFAVIYFIYLILTSDKIVKLRDYIRVALSFGLFSLLAGGIGAMMFIPELNALGYTISGEFNFPETWTNYFSILDMLSRSLISVPVSIFSAHDPNLYCTVAVFVMIPLFVICSKIPAKERIGKVLMVVLFLISFNMNIPNYIWHGFHFPNSLPARESFIYIFLLVIMSYEAVIHIKSFTGKQILGAFAGATALLLLIEEMYVDTTDYPFEIVYRSLIFIAVYTALAAIYNYKKLRKTIVVYALFVVCIAETIVNSTHEDSYKTTSYTAYVEDNEAIESLVAKVNEDDKDFFRIEKLDRKTKNDAAWNDYHGVSIFSSMTNGKFTDYLGLLGFEKSANAYSYYGFTPFTSALLDVKYVISNEYMVNDDWYTLVDAVEEQSRYIYKVNYSLPLGFMIPKNFNDNIEMAGNNPFAIQNSFASVATGYENMFTYIPAKSTGATCTFTLEEDSDVYVYCTTYVESISFTARREDGSVVTSDTFSGLKHRQICHFGEMPAGTEVIVNTSDSVGSLQLYAYNFDKEVFDDVYESLNSQPLEISEYTDTYIKGEVTAGEAGDLYTSIIYDKGWTAYVDGEEVEISSLKEALITIPVPEGTHTIELKYRAEGKIQGIILTVLSIIILILIIIFEKKIKEFIGNISKRFFKEKKNASEDEI